MKAIRVLLIIIPSLLFSLGVYAQKGRGHHPHHRRHGAKVVVVKRSPYRPAKIVVFHPGWRPAYSYYRRWLFFPKYNLYWDNWRNHWVFWNGTVWVSQPVTPPVIVNVNVADEKSYEMKEGDDDTDDIYKSNDAHKNQYQDK